MNALSSEARKSAADATSSGLAWRPAGSCPRRSRRRGRPARRRRLLDRVLERVVHRTGVRGSRRGCRVRRPPSRQSASVPRARAWTSRTRRSPVGGQPDHAGVEDQAAAVAHHPERVAGEQERAAHVDRHHLVEHVLGYSATGATAPNTPALANATSSPPKRSTARTTRSHTSAETVTSPRSAAARSPAPPPAPRARPRRGRPAPRARPRRRTAAPSPLRCSRRRP